MKATKEYLNKWLKSRMFWVYNPPLPVLRRLLLYNCYVTTVDAGGGREHIGLRSVSEVRILGNCL